MWRMTCNDLLIILLRKSEWCFGEFYCNTIQHNWTVITRFNKIMSCREQSVMVIHVIKHNVNMVINVITWSKQTSMGPWLRLHDEVKLLDKNCIYFRKRTFKQSREEYDVVEDGIIAWLERLVCTHCIHVVL